MILRRSEYLSRLPWFAGLRLPMFGSPMFIVSSKELVAEQCKAGIVGTLPALNARPAEELDVWLSHIEAERERWDANPDKPWPAAPYAVNLMTHPSNVRFEADLKTIVKHRVPLVISSLSHPARVVEAVHAYGGVVFHDVSNMRFAHKALEAGVDGLVLVCAGAGGHTGQLNPMAFVAEVRAIFDGPIAVAGGITNGRQLLAVQAMGADIAYVGTRFIPSAEANAPDAYKHMVLASGIDDITCTNAVTGLYANYLTKSFEALGIDPSTLAVRSKSSFNLGGGDTTQVKAWKDVWSAGHGVGASTQIETARAIVDRFAHEYEEARLQFMEFLQPAALV